mgnify:CR=1 FL=1
MPISGKGMNDMYAVIKTGGKQYRVQEGGIVRVEKLDAEAGAAVGVVDTLRTVPAGFSGDVSAANVEARTGTNSAPSALRRSRWWIVASSSCAYTDDMPCEGRSNDTPRRTSSTAEIEEPFRCCGPG